MCNYVGYYLVMDRLDILVLEYNWGKNKGYGEFLFQLVIVA